MSWNQVLKTLSIFFFLTILFADGNAQFSIGIHGGGTLSEMDFTNNPKYNYVEVNYTSGFIGGLVVQFINEKHAGIQAEFNYSQRGWIEMDTLFDNNLKNSNYMDYLELPILTHVNIGGGSFRGLFNIGPYIGYALNRSGSVTDLDTGIEESFDYTFDSEVDNRLDFGLMAGGGFEYRTSFGKFAAEVRYTVGLGDVNKIKIQKSAVSQFRVLAVMIRYIMPLGKSD